MNINFNEHTHSKACFCEYKKNVTAFLVVNVSYLVLWQIIIYIFPVLGEVSIAPDKALFSN